LVSHLCKQLDKYIDLDSFENENEKNIAQFTLAIFVTSFDEDYTTKKVKNEIMEEFTYERLLRCLNSSNV
jgi:hypothetical protein